MDFNRLHLIESKEQKIAYYYPTNDIMALNDKQFQIIQLLKVGTCPTEIARLCKCTEIQLDVLMNSLKKAFTKSKTKKNPPSTNTRNRTIERITLHVSNDCNLKCKYCYANGGNYNQSRSLMTIDTARNFVNFCINQFDRIDKIIFFGGEPMLNLNAMNFICKKFKEYFYEGKSSFIPMFGIITNGTLLTPKILQFIKENISIVTVSIDGPKNVNDANRVFKNGKVSYERIAQFIQTILKETKALVQYESTYTHSHIDVNCSYRDVIKHMYQNFKIEGQITVDKNIYTDYINNFCSQNIDQRNVSVNNLTNVPLGFRNFIYAITRKVQIPMCPIVNDIFAVSAAGTIYACHMLNGKDKHSLGNINDKNIFNSPSLYQSFPIDFKDNTKCNKCWAQNLCGGCVLQMFYDESSEKLTNEPITDRCEITKHFLEKVILMITLIRQNTILWKTFLEKEKDFGIR